MFLIIPAIKFSEGQIIDPIIGEKTMRKYYEKLKNDPVKLCQLMRKENSKSIAIFEYDSYNNKNNSENIAKIIEIANNIDIPIQLISKINSIETAKEYL